MADGDQSPMDMSWDALVSKYGTKRASELAPTKDPQYQQDVQQMGQAKGSEEFAQQVLDPETEQGGLTSDIMTGIAEEGGHGLVGDVGQTAARGIYGIGRAVEDVPHLLLGGKGISTPGEPPSDPSKPKGGGGRGGGGGAQVTADQAIEGLFNSLAGQYEQEMGAMQPYITGQDIASGTQAAQEIAQAYGGQAVQGMSPAAEEMMQKDTAAVGAAETAGAQYIAQGLSQEGQALGGYMGASPYLGLLSALQSEAQYQTETQAATGQPSPAFTTQPLAPGIEAAYQALAQATAAGGATVPGAKTTGSTPTSDTTTAAGGSGIG